jgi:hypothetical protein
MLAFLYRIAEGRMNRSNLGGFRVKSYVIRLIRIALDSLEGVGEMTETHFSNERRFRYHTVE